LSPAASALQAITDRMVAAIRAGEELDPAFGTELATLREKYAASDPEVVAEIALTQAAVAMRIEGMESALAAFRDVTANFPDSRAAAVAARQIGMMEERIAADQRAADFVGSEAPELDFTWVSEGEAQTLSDLRGKVVVLDFWATWCGPCVRSFPQVRELTDHYADSDVAVVGVTSLQGQVHGLEDSPINTRDDSAKEHLLMNDYMSKYDINWTVVFTEQKVFNDDYGVRGIPHMAIIAPDGTVRHSGLHPAMPHAEKVAMVDAILAEFDLPLPDHG
jgi:thiol-disulfide isomerase/thioredoxin